MGRTRIGHQHREQSDESDAESIRADAVGPSNSSAEARALRARAARSGLPLEQSQQGTAGDAKLPYAHPASVVQSHEDGYEGVVFLKIPTPLELGESQESGSQRRFNVRLLDTEWQASIAQALATGLQSFANQVRRSQGGPQLDFGDTLAQAGADASAAVHPFVEASLKDRLFPDGFSPQGVLGFAKSYPIAAFVGGLLGGAAATAYLADTIMKKGILALDAGPVSGKVNLDTLDWEIMVKVSIKF